jgi:hypothetical protein
MYHGEHDRGLELDDRGAEQIQRDRRRFRSSQLQNIPWANLSHSGSNLAFLRIYLTPFKKYDDVSHRFMQLNLCKAAAYTYVSVGSL